jgi:hypothetical protein
MAQGSQLPAALSATVPNLQLSPAEEAVKEQIAQEFLEEISEADPAAEAEDERVVTAEEWTPAQRRADDRLRLLLGDLAYVQQNLETAREALSE